MRMKFVLYRLLLKPKAKHTVVNDSVKPMNLIIMCGPNGTPYEYFTYTVN